ncbi:hypothetical protein [Enterococcus sp. AZ109]|uniref:hypothetical protein n=1 Tax=Enterococcus sp. AZ109 TaxID=2774634 RepID=UPI003F23572F
MKRVMGIIVSVLFLLAGCTVRSTGTGENQTFETYVTQAEKLVKEQDYSAAIVEYDKALSVDTKQNKQPIEDDKAGVNVLIAVNKLMNDESYKEVIERLGPSDLRKSKEVIVHNELEDVYQLARQKQQEQWEAEDIQQEERTNNSKTASSTSLGDSTNDEQGESKIGRQTLTEADHSRINQDFLAWAIPRAELGGMAISSRYFTHGAAGIGDWYAQTIDGDVQMQDNGHPGADAFDIHSVGGCVFYTSLDGTIGLDQKAENSSTAENYYINLDRSKPVHIYLLGDNGQVYEYIFIPDKEEQLGGVFGELNDDGTKGNYGPTKIFAISNDSDARAKLNELLTN